MNLDKVTRQMAPHLDFLLLVVVVVVVVVAAAAAAASEIRFFLTRSSLEKISFFLTGFISSKW